MFYEIRNNAEVSALCAGAGWAASAQLSSCGGCGHLPVETPAGGGGEEQSCRVECFAYNKHSREILMILLDIFPVQVFIKHFSQKPSEVGVFHYYKVSDFPQISRLLGFLNKYKTKTGNVFIQWQFVK